MVIAFVGYGCDSGVNVEADPEGPDRKIVQVDLAAYEAAVELLRAQPAKDANGEYQDPPHVMTDEDKPLLVFESEEDLRMYQVIAEAQAIQGNPYSIHSSLEKYLEFRESALPISELALADENGQLIVAGSELALEGDLMVKTNADGLRVREHSLSEIHLRVTDIPNDLEFVDGYAHKINSSGEDDYYLSPSIWAKNDDGNWEELKAAGAHNAYSTWTGQRRANAQTEIIYRDGSKWKDIKEKSYVGSTVDAYVMTQAAIVGSSQDQCGYGRHGDVANSGNNSKLHAKAGADDRVQNYGVTFSAHKAMLKTKYYGPNYFSGFGPNDSRNGVGGIGTCTHLSSPNVTINTRQDAENAGITIW